MASDLDRQLSTVDSAVDVEKVVARGRFNRVVWERSQVGHVRIIGLGGHHRGARGWGAQEPDLAFDVLCSGSQEELLLNEPQPAQAETV